MYHAYTLKVSSTVAVLLVLVTEKMGLSHTAYVSNQRVLVTASSSFPPPCVYASSETTTGDGSRGELDADLQAHSSPHIGPDTHRLMADEVEVVHKMRDEERADGSHASLATQMENR